MKFPQMENIYIESKAKLQSETGIHAERHKFSARVSVLARSNSERFKHGMQSGILNNDDIFSVNNAFLSGSIV